MKQIKCTKYDQFKKNVDSITFAEIVKMRELKSKHALKLEDLEITLKVANEYLEIMRAFLEELSFGRDRIGPFECRSRDGFISFSHNKGGLEGVCYRDQYSACENTGFEKTDIVLEKSSEYDRECFFKDKGIPKNTILSEEQENDLAEYSQDSDDTIQFQARIMFTSETSANVDFYVSASDSPYHRSSDDSFETSINFKTPNGLKKKLNALKKHPFVICMKKNVRGGF